MFKTVAAIFFLLLSLLVLPTVANATDAEILATAISSTEANSTIAVTDTFQALLAAPTSGTIRQGCLFQNQGAASMYIFIGAIGSATKAKSFIVTAGSSFSCDLATGRVEQGVLNVTGTSTQAYIIFSW